MKIRFQQTLVSVRLFHSMRPFKLYLILFTLAVGSLVGRNALAETQTYVLVNNSDIEVLKRFDLTNLFSMRTRVWQNGTPVQVFVLAKRSNVHQQFVMQNLGMMPFQLDRYWQRLVFSGMAKAPKEVRSVSEMIRNVLKTPGAIGYIDDAHYDKIEDKSFVKRIEK